MNIRKRLEFSKYKAHQRVAPFTVNVTSIKKSIIDNLNVCGAIVCVMILKNVQSLDAIK